jgi:hypothetical protein
VLSAVGRVYTGLVAAIAVGVGSAVAAALAERGRAHLADRATAAGSRSGLYVARVDEIMNPIRLGAHPAAAVEHDDGRIDRTPAFVERDRMPDLKAALASGGFVLVVGDSTAGKTRLAYEAMRVCLPRHVCVKPETSDALPAAIAAARQQRPSVLWLDDLEQYLGIGGLTRTDLVDLVGGGQIVVLATMRSHERDDLSARHDPERPASDRQVARAGRDVLAVVDREIRLQRRWSDRELTSAGKLVHDVRIAQALDSADTYGLAEVLAAGPQLLADWQDAWSAAPRTSVPGRTYGDARGAAVVSVAVDIRRAGYHRPVPIGILQVLHEEYLRDRGGAVLRPGTWENALAWATQPLHATSSLLVPMGEDRYLAFDYLVDAAAWDLATSPVPDATWQALIEHAEPADVVEIAWQASFAGHVEHVTRAFDRALAAGQYLAATHVAICLGDAGPETRAVELLELTIERAEAGGTVSAADLLAMRRDLAWELGEKVGGHGDPVHALGIIRQVADESTALLGADHPDTLLARIGLARQLGASGNLRQALDIARDVGARATQQDMILSARFEAALWTRDLDGPAAAARLFRELLEYAESLESVSWSFVIDCAWNLGGALVDAGDAEAALPLLDNTVEESKRVYGWEHRRTLNVRLTHINAVGAAGDPRKAVELAGRLAADSDRRLGAGHLTTLQARFALATWTGECGDEATARQFLAALHADTVRHFGEDHWLAIDTRTKPEQP